MIAEPLAAIDAVLADHRRDHYGAPEHVRHTLDGAHWPVGCSGPPHPWDWDVDDLWAVDAMRWMPPDSEGDRVLASETTAATITIPERWRAATRLHFLVTQPPSGPVHGPIRITPT